MLLFGPACSASTSRLTPEGDQASVRRKRYCPSYSHCISILYIPIVLAVGYVPDGMTPEQWKKYQQAEKDKQKSKNFAAVGPQSFKSRSLQSFQTDLEKGKAKHLLPVMFAKDRVKKGEIKQEDVPYMQVRSIFWSCFFDIFYCI